MSNGATDNTKTIKEYKDFDISSMAIEINKLEIKIINSRINMNLAKLPSIHSDELKNIIFNENKEKIKRLILYKDMLQLELDNWRSSR